MKATYTLSLLVMCGFTLVAWIGLVIAADPLASSFKAEGEARDLIVFFCRWLSPLFVFLGALFIANAAFNTLGRAHYSTLLNWGRATVGTVPFVMAGAHFGGAHGVLAGHFLGGVLFGVIAVAIGSKYLEKVGENLP
jgi:Na+-driven multidrug efflux pump